MSEIATLAGGCFWCIEAIFEQLKGVFDVQSGYTGGHVSNPSYQDVCSETTGHAEAIQIQYDPEVISYRELLEIFFSTHDPTTLNRQGPDVGTRYRSAIFYDGAEQASQANEMVAEMTELWANPIVTEIVALDEFYHAEDYHAEYYRSNINQPYCQFVINPKVIKFREKYQGKLKVEGSQVTS
ncbi:MAG: peptide-methionine (S)-S-oxide reductase [Chloroflexi bacterium]|jgi:peptide-methionine (S)-S-oxide reductase|nr:MAG: peptide-methionine (S)-S-oxide reductase [Chloroflexota bacterium]